MRRYKQETKEEREERYAAEVAHVKFLERQFRGWATFFWETWKAVMLEASNKRK
jgi:hypothetical protein